MSKYIPGNHKHLNAADRLYIERQLNAKNFCIHRLHCQKKNVCGKIILCDIECASCPSCNQHCKDFVKERCQRLDRAPYVCNGCVKGHSLCTIPPIRSLWSIPSSVFLSVPSTST